jgi:hypothetical protein
MSIRKYARVAALGAVGVAFAVLGLYLVIAIGSAPPAAGGIDRTEGWVAWIAAAIPCLAIIAAHLVYAKILMDESKKA